MAIAICCFFLIPVAQVVAQGACCTAVSCADAEDEAFCDLLGGVFLEGESCVAGQCGPGACCAGLACAIDTAHSCITQGRDYQGAGTICEDDPCEIEIGACCVGGGVCMAITPEECDAEGGTHVGIGTVCESGACFIGGCCLNDECTDTFQFQCNDMGGDFQTGQLCFVDPCSAADSCPENSLEVQTPDFLVDFEAGTSELTSPFQLTDNFQGVDGAVDTITFWGFDLSNVPGTDDFIECVRSDNTFQINFHRDAGGAPGPIQCSYEVEATREPTGLIYLFAELNKYTVSLPTPCAMTRGWLSIVGLGDAECWFLWITSPDGDGFSFCDGCASTIQNLDRAFCLQGEVGGVTGACCSDGKMDCQEGIDISDCASSIQRFEADATCDELVPECGNFIGACCRKDATCSLELVNDCMGPGEQWLGQFTLCDQCPCEVACLEGSGAEGEPTCFAGYIDEYNGGCSSAEQLFTPINSCDTICAESGVFLLDSEFTPDEDWYELTIDELTNVTVTVEAEYMSIAVIFDAAAGCAGAPEAAGVGDACEPIVLSAFVAPGTYWIALSPVAASDEALCGGADYVLSVSTPDCGSTTFGDFDGDGDVDLVDFGEFQLCYSGPGVPAPSGCDAGDSDTDGDVDLVDFAEFQLAFTGPM
jgi:hypothetical protein